MNMNPLIKQHIGSFVRWALTVGAAWLVSKGYEAPTFSEETIVAIITLVTTLLWSMWQKRHMLRKYFTAAATPEILTMKEVDEKIAAGAHANASTPAGAVPVLHEKTPQ